MENINALDEINKGACMGMDAISFVLDKIEDESFKKVVKKQNTMWYFVFLCSKVLPKSLSFAEVNIM